VWSTTKGGAARPRREQRRLDDAARRARQSTRGAYQEPFAAAKLRDLHGSQREYLRKFEASLGELDKQGWSLPVYRAALLADAARVEF